MGFADYLWELAHVVFKRKWDKASSDIYKTFQVVGGNCDELKQNIFSIRENALIYTAYGDALDYHGKDRLIARYTDETDEDYRNRLLVASDIYSIEGSVSGMITALERLGYSEIDIYELFKEKYQQNPNPLYEGLWAEFIVKIGSATDIPFGSYNYQTMNSVIKKFKRAGTKLYSIAYMVNPETQIVMDNNFRFGQQLQTAPRGVPVPLNGTKKLNGTWKLDSMIFKHSLQFRAYKNDVLMETVDF